MRMRYLWLVLLMFVGSACTNTDLIASWTTTKPVDYQHLLVVGITTNPATRRIFEDTFSTEAQSRHIAAMPSYRYVAESGKIEKSRLAQAVEQSGADAMVIMRLVAVDRRLVQTPGYWSPAIGSPYGYYDYYWYGYYEPPRVYEETTVILETNMYDARNSEIVWSGTTRSIEPYNLNSEMRKVSKLLVDKMVKDRILRTSGRASLPAISPERHRTLITSTDGGNHANPTPLPVCPLSPGS